MSGNLAAFSLPSAPQPWRAPLAGVAAPVLAALALAVLAGCSGDVLPAAAGGDGAATDDAGDAAILTGTDAEPGTDAVAAELASDAALDVADAAGDGGADLAEAADDAVSDDAPGDDVPADDVTADTGPGKCSPAQIAACDDKVMCTTDKCTMPGGVCAWSMASGWCIINGACVAAGVTKAGSPCDVCDPTANPKGWTALADGKSCDDGDLCTYEGKCQGKACVSKVTPCSDGNTCTVDSCDAKLGCVYTNLPGGTACDDGSACTLADACTAASCEGKAQNCDDKNPCTEDACELAKGCTHSNLEGACSDGDACTAGDVCAGGVCQKGSAKNCDDGNTCTIDKCYPKSAEGCYHLSKQSPCCVGETSICDDGNACTSDDCDPATSACNHVDNAATCDDGNACSSGDICAAGACVGSGVTCNDGNPCTNDACDKAKGCVFVAVAASTCDDAKACTEDACDPVAGCAHTFNTAACEDGDNCTVGDACKDGACTAGGAKNCDDGNVCTFDQCYPNVAGGCYHLATKSPCCVGQTSICDDGDTCTNDDCDPATSACLHSNNTAPCDDKSACSSGDVCAGGTCTGTTVNCDDGNPCSTDACDPKLGCVHGNIDGGSCDDGNPCSTGDLCAAGKCVGQGQCTCTMTFSKQASKFTSIAIGDGGKPGEGLDVDSNPATCAPSTNCTAGINNALGALAALANAPLQKSVASGSVNFILEYRDLKQGPITLGLYTGKLAADNPTCDLQTQTCNYNVAASLVNYTKCLPVVFLPGKLAGDVVLAGGKGTNFPFSLPIQNGVTLDIVIYNAQLSGTVQTDSAGTITSFDGVLGGAVPKATLMAAIDALPDGSLPIPKDSLKAILDSTVETDIDSNGDGSLDAASIGLKLHGIQGNIVGTY